MHWDAKNIFKTLPFFNTYIDKPDIKKISNLNYYESYLIMMN